MAGLSTSSFASRGNGTYVLKYAGVNMDVHEAEADFKDLDMITTRLHERLSHWLRSVFKTLFRQNLKYPPPVIAFLLPDDAKWDEKGLLPLEYAYKPLPVQIPAWDYQNMASYNVVLRVYWDDITLVYEKTWPGATYPTLPVDDLLFDFPASHLTAGTHSLYYEVTEYLGNFASSEYQTVNIDLTGPILGNNQGQLQFETAQITAEYLENNGDEADGLIESYLGGKPGDVVTWYWAEGQFDVGEHNIVSRRTLYREDLDRSVVLSFPGSVIRARGDGERYAFYQITDRAGNSSPFSYVVLLQVQVQPLPRYLPSPSVAEASGLPSSSTLDPSRAVRGATVVISDAIIRPEDVLSVQWATPGTEGAFHATVADASGLRFSIPSTCIVQHMGKCIPVYYQVAGSDPATSELHSLTVQSMANNKWPTVQCTRPVGVVRQLSLTLIEGYATFSLEKWAFMAPGQRVTITLLGVGNTQVILDDYPVQAGDITASKVTVDVLKNVFQAFTIDQALDVRVSVSFASGAAPANFPSLSLTLVS
ncbi:hypothetical protein ALQ71_100743 [Pseudomonas coronafaciens pv. striafaciens]|nr:hypothetical protein ALQ71_100743 [Pseudomonas coronafaciens pv. striafaciens]